MKHAPLFVRCFDLAAWICRHVSAEQEVGRRLHAQVNDLLDHVVLALKGWDRWAQLDAADACNALLRARLGLAVELDLIDERQMLFLAGELDDIGRQLGGWMRSLGGRDMPSARLR
ncbi:MAG: four helix bundle protein [Alphaproteobacteria bacterium]|nr:four helix bundle protein [Alphaproteobacteria bacterium]